MIQGIDHLVIACGDPDAAASELETSLGLASRGGGRHEGLGTFNRIVWLADGSYLELIGVDDRVAAMRQPIGAAAIRALDANGGGLATYALAVDDIERFVSLRAGEGATLEEPQHGSRVRPDGELVEWWSAVPRSALAADAPPFLIQHHHSGAEWGPEAIARRATFVHPIGSRVTLQRLDIATDDPLSAAADLHGQIGLEIIAVADLAVCHLGAHIVRYVPRRATPVPAIVTLAARVGTPRSVDLLGMRFDVQPVDVVASPFERRSSSLTSGTG